MQCLEEIKAWMALHFLNFNENKIPGGICESVDLDLGELKSLVKILGVFLDCDFKLDIQINSVIKSSFFQLVTKVKFVLPPKDFQIILHIFVSTHLDYCNGLFIGISQASLSRLQCHSLSPSALCFPAHIWFSCPSFLSSLVY